MAIPFLPAVAITCFILFILFVIFDRPLKQPCESCYSLCIPDKYSTEAGHSKRWCWECYHSKYTVQCRSCLDVDLLDLDDYFEWRMHDTCKQCLLAISYLLDLEFQEYQEKIRRNTWLNPTLTKQ